MNIIIIIYHSISSNLLNVLYILILFNYQEWSFFTIEWSTDILIVWPNLDILLPAATAYFDLLGESKDL